MTTIYLAYRNLVLQRKRYFLIALAVMAGFALVTVISGSAYGAMETVKVKAARYFAGHVSISGYTNGAQIIDDPGAVESAILNAGLPVRTVSRRTLYNNTETKLFFGGESVRQRRLIGVEFDVEHGELENLLFVEGSVGAMLGESGRDGILISESAARLMGARLGDDLNLYLLTDSGQYNTATLVVRGVFSETSLFGYVAYMRNEDLNRLLVRPRGAATDVAVYAVSGADQLRLTAQVRDVLEKDFSPFPPLATKEALVEILTKGEGGNKLAVLSLDAHLAQIKSILDAFLVITYFVLVLFVLIVMVGILNTYRVLVYERTREIGTMRALGMKRESVSAMFLAEALGLALVATILGLVVGIAILAALGLVDVSHVPAAGLFTDRGHLSFHLAPRVIALNAGIMIAGVMAAALGPARKAARVQPVEAMRGDS